MIPVNILNEIETIGLNELNNFPLKLRIMNGILNSLLDHSAPVAIIGERKDIEFNQIK
jgi:hypothetical protein